MNALITKMWLPVAAVMLGFAVIPATVNSHCAVTENIDVHTVRGRKLVWLTLC